MREQGSVFGGAGASLEVRYTDKPVSGWGGLVAVMRYMDRLRVREWLKEGLADGRTSPNQIPVVDIAMGFMMAVLSGARRFAHVERLRADEVGHFGRETDAFGDDLDALFWRYGTQPGRASVGGAGAVQRAPVACSGAGRGTGPGLHRL